jgi:hypothetical protein
VSAGLKAHCSTVVEGGRAALRRVAENVMGDAQWRQKGVHGPRWGWLLCRLPSAQPMNSALSDLLRIFKLIQICNSSKYSFSC